MQKDKHNRNGRPLNHVLKYEEIFSEWTLYEDFYISYFFSCHEQLCVYGDELRIVLLLHTPISSCPHHSTSQCLPNVSLSSSLIVESPSLISYWVHITCSCPAQAKCHQGQQTGSRVRRAEVKMAFLSSQKAQVYLPLSELSTHGQQRQISTQ